MSLQDSTGKLRFFLSVYEGRNQHETLATIAIAKRYIKCSSVMAVYRITSVIMRTYMNIYMEIWMNTNTHTHAHTYIDICYTYKRIKTLVLQTRKILLRVTQDPWWAYIQNNDKNTQIISKIPVCVPVFKWFVKNGNLLVSNNSTNSQVWNSCNIL